MSDTRFSPVDAPERVTEPSKAWKNWWQIATDIDEDRWRLGKRFSATRTYPSKDVAESAAHRDMLLIFQGHDYADWVTHLGAFPDGEAP